MIKKLSEVLKERSDAYYREGRARDIRDKSLAYVMSRHLNGDILEGVIINSISDTTALYHCHNFPLNELRMGRQALFRSAISNKKITYMFEAALGDYTKLYGLNVSTTLKGLFMIIGDNTTIGTIDISSGYAYGSCRADNIIAVINIGNNVVISNLHIQAGDVFRYSNEPYHVDIWIEDDVTITELYIKLPSECTRESRIEIRIGKGTIMLGGGNCIEFHEPITSPRGTIVDIGTNNICNNLSLKVFSEKDKNKQRIIKIGADNTFFNVSVAPYGDVYIGNNNMLSTRQDFIFSGDLISVHCVTLNLDSSKRITIGDRNYIATSIVSRVIDSNGSGTLGSISIGSDTKLVGSSSNAHPAIEATDITLEDGATLVVASKGNHTSRAAIRTRVIVGKDATFALSLPYADTGFGYNVKVTEIKIPNKERVLI